MDYLREGLAPQISRARPSEPVSVASGQFEGSSSDGEFFVSFTHQYFEPRNAMSSVHVAHQC